MGGQMQLTQWIGGLALLAGTAAAESPTYNADIRPILSENCFACHGPDSASREAGLRLDVAEKATAELESGLRAISPGDITASELLARVTSDDPDIVMPPPGAKLGRLSSAEVEKLSAWIGAGAAYEPHWTFVPATRLLQDQAASQAIDTIVSEGLAARGLSLQAEAEKTTLIRRASFDLTGLPPSIAEIEAFLADTRPDAYEQLLDRLLTSPRYGERMAADWLDLARYSDSYGFQVDRERPTMWPWRDWVIRSFNENLPWDDFTRWQLAGDLLPNATAEQRLATAFNRLHQQEAEGGSVEEEYRVAYVNDRVTTFGTAFLGLTLECCRCHDHKFDPVSQREYYQLFAFFDDVDEAGLYSYFTQSTPTPKMPLLDAAAATARDAAAARVVEAEAQLEARKQATRDRFATAVASNDTTLSDAVAQLVAGGIPGELVHYTFDEQRSDGKFQSLTDPSPMSPDEANQEAAEDSDNEAKKPDPPPDRAATTPSENTLVDREDGKAILLTGDHPVTTPVGNFRRSHPFSVAIRVKPAEAYERAVIFHRSQAWTDAASRGYELLVVDGHLQWSLIHFWPGDAISVRAAEPLPVGSWSHVCVSSDGSSTAAGLQIFVDGRPVATEIVRDHLTREITGGGGDTIRIGERMRDHGFKGGEVDDFRVFDRQLTPIEVRETHAPGTIAAVLNAVTAGTATSAEHEAVATWHASAVDADVAMARAAVEAARVSRDDLAEKPAEIMVMREMDQPKVAFVLARGDYDKRQDAVSPGTPAVLPPFPNDQPRNRLGLARWLTDPDHPLLARVTVNRIWQSLFGIGLVPSAEDLGSQAKPAEYPQLLDEIAWRFSHSQEAGGLDWDLKQLLKAIMLSKAYRQRSIADARTMADDPQNMWLARGPRHRLPAEMIRDNALAASGLLVERVGGPPVKTYDLPDSFKPTAAGTGEDLFRRSIYTFWRRTGPGPVLEAFDVPNRVVCVAKRDTTNTPLHAFVLLNATQFVEASRVLAQETLLAHQGAAEPALAESFRRLTSREPDNDERSILASMHKAQHAWYEGHPEAAEELLGIGETPRAEGIAAVDLAAVASVVNALMNYDGCVVKR
jgi:cytochrome c553